MGNYALPRGKVQDQFPNAVRSRNGVRRGSFGVDSFEDFHQRWTVPGLAIEGAIQLVNSVFDLRHIHNLAFRISINHQRCHPKFVHARARRL
jgi:hypothetical protein